MPVCSPLVRWSRRFRIPLCSCSAFSTHTSFWALLPGLLCHGVGIGFATSQLTNVVMSDIPPQKAGSASGAASMVRQVGTALGIAMIGAIFTSQSATRIARGLKAIPGLPDAVRAQIAAGSKGFGGASGSADPRIGRVISSGIVHASRSAILFACFTVVVGAALSTLVPNVAPQAHGRPPTAPE